MIDPPEKKNPRALEARREQTQFPVGVQSVLGVDAHVERRKPGVASLHVAKLLPLPFTIYVLSPHSEGEQHVGAPQAHSVTPS